MRKFKTLAVFFCFLLASLMYVPAETNQDQEDSKKILELSERVELLEGRIKALEQKLQMLATQTRVLIPESFPQIQKIPDDWSEFEFNGMKYFSIPLKTEQKRIEKKKK